MNQWGGRIEPRGIGRMASTHNVPCSCSRCGNPRRIFGTKTRQEVKEDLLEKEELDELYDDITYVQPDSLNEGTK